MAKGLYRLRGKATLMWIIASPLRGNLCSRSFLVRAGKSARSRENRLKKMDQRTFGPASKIKSPIHAVFLIGSEAVVSEARPTGVPARAARVGWSLGRATGGK